MSHAELARNLLTAFCALQGAGTITLDLNRTHAAHPQWLGHARFHVVWQVVTTALLSVFAIGLIWTHGPLQPERFYSAALLAALPIFGFFAALAARRIYGGTLSDPGGIPPLILKVNGRNRSVDLSVVTEIAALATVILLVVLFRSQPQTPSAIPVTARPNAAPSSSISCLPWSGEEPRSM